MSARLHKNRHAGKSDAYRQLWRVVDGAVFDALYTHPDYLTEKGRRSARTSINKRVVGAIMGFAEQSARGRSGEIPAAERVGTPGRDAVPHGAFCYVVSKWRALLTGARQSLLRWRQN